MFPKIYDTADIMQLVRFIYGPSKFLPSWKIVANLVH